MKSSELYKIIYSKVLNEKDETFADWKTHCLYPELEDEALDQEYDEDIIEAIKCAVDWVVPYVAELVTGGMVKALDVILDTEKDVDLNNNDVIDALSEEVRGY